MRIREEIYNDIAYVPTSDKAFFHGIHFDRKSERNILVVNEEKEFTANGRTYHATLQ